MFGYYQNYMNFFYTKLHLKVLNKEFEHWENHVLVNMLPPEDINYSLVHGSKLLAQLFICPSFLGALLRLSYLVYS